jgi:DNA modification methylase
MWQLWSNPNRKLFKLQSLHKRQQIELMLFDLHSASQASLMMKSPQMPKAK